MVEAAALRFTVDALGERGQRVDGVGTGGALEGGRAGDCARIADRNPVGIVALGGPDGDQLDLARLGGSVGLLAGPARELGAPDRDAGAVHAQIHRRRRRRIGRDHVVFVGGDPASQGLGRAFDVRGRDVHAGEFVQQVVALREADHRAHDADHARDRRRERRPLQPERAVARTDADVTGRAVIVGALERQRPQHALEGFAAPASVVGGLLTPDAGGGGPDVVTVVRVQALGDRARRDGQGLATGSRFDRLQIPRVDRPGADQFGDLPRNFRLERRTEPPFSPGGAGAAVSASISASARRSQAAQYSAVASRNWRPTSIWRRTVSARSGARSRVRVVPATDRVRLT